MKRRRWLDRLFSLSLYLYPRDFRRQFGEEMREVFHQQCQRQHNRLRLLGELLLDNLRAAPTEHGRAFAQQGIARLHLLMALLCVALAGLMLRPQISFVLNAAMDRVTTTIRNVEEQRLLAVMRDEGSAMATRANRLLQSGTDIEKTMVALLYVKEATFRKSDTRGEHAAFWLLSGDIPKDQINQTLGRALRSTNPVELQAVVVACASWDGCDPKPALDRLTLIDANNAATWMIASDLFGGMDTFKTALALGTVASDKKAARHALQNALTADHYRSFQREALATWYEKIWVKRFESHWWTPHDADHYLTTATISAFDIMATPILTSCRGTPVDTELCQQVAEHWKHSADDLYTALWMHRSAKGYIKPLPKTSLEKVSWSFSNALVANIDDPDLQPKAMAERIRKVGSLALMQEVVAQSTDLNSTENLH